MKGAILMVKFGVSFVTMAWRLKPAIIEASALRLRPILITMVVTILPALTLAVDSGARATSRRHIDLVVVGDVGRLNPCDTVF
jgi:multidrug efflux pump